MNIYPYSVSSSESIGNITVERFERSPLDFQMETDLESVIMNPDEFAEEIIFTFSDGTEKTFNAIFDDESTQVDPETGVPVLSNIPILWFQTSKLNRRIEKDTKVEIRGAMFQIVKDEPDGTGLTQLTLQKEKTI